MATPDIKVIKLKLRRGSDAQRKTIVLDQGEMGYTIDTKRVFVGDGSTVGGIPVSNKVSTTVTLYRSLSDTAAEVDDIVVADKVAYQLTYSDFTSIGNWRIFTSPPDNTYVSFTNLSSGSLTIKSGSIDSTRLNAVSLSSTSVSVSSNKLVVNYDTNQFTISGDKFAIAQQGIKPIHISTSSISRGLTGGNGQPLSAYVDGTTISYDAGGRLTVISTPITAIGYQNLGSGFNINPVNNIVSTNVVGVDSRTFALCSGLVTWLGSGIDTPYATLTANDTSEKYFNGSPNQFTSGYNPTEGRSLYTTISSNGATIVLSSAGFFVFEGNGFTQGTKFAVPVFTLP